jgi:hypothetical protein
MNAEVSNLPKSDSSYLVQIWYLRKNHETFSAVIFFERLDRIR